MPGKVVRAAFPSLIDSRRRGRVRTLGQQLRVVIGILNRSRTSNSESHRSPGQQHRRAECHNQHRENRTEGY